MENGTNTMTRDLTEGSVAGLLMRFALPLFVSNALQAVYSLVDMVVVGQYIGGAGMAAVSIGGDILRLLTFLAMGFSSAGQVLIAQYVGARDSDRVQKTIGTMFTTLLCISVALTIVCYFLKDTILHLLNTPEEAYAYTMDYTVTCIWGLAFIYGYNIVSAILRGMGDSKRPFVFIAIAAVFNMALDIVFVKYCGMEVFGAALATVIGQGVSFVASIVYLYLNKESFGFDFRIRSFKIDRFALFRILSLGIPMAIQSAAISFSKIVLTAWINAEGMLFAAMGGIYNKVNMVSGIVSNSFTTAGSSMVGQNLGARKNERVPVILKTVLGTGLIIATFFSAVLLAFNRQIFALFTSDANVLASASIVVLPTVFNFYGSATRSMAFSLINGSGNTRLNLAVALIDGVISRVGIASLMGFALGMGCRGFWFGDALAGFMPIAIGATYYISGRWKR
ncbi:MAG: MATE family efflux transporter [Christensenellales bacterium]|jgi:putative MATE family efflux protein